VPPLVDPRAVEMNIFADLTISKRQKSVLAVYTKIFFETFLTYESVVSGEQF
jgi:hypothetical protein